MTMSNLLLGEANNLLSHDYWWLMIGMIVLLVFFTSSQLEEKDLIKLWRKLTENNKGMFFIFKPFGQKAYIATTYRGYDLKVELHATSERHSGLHTNVIMTTPTPSPHQDALKDKSVFHKLVIVKEPIDNSFVIPDVFKKLKKDSFINAKSNGQQVVYGQVGLENDTQYLQMIFDLLCDIAYVYPYVVKFGAETVPVLKVFAEKREHPLNLLAIQLLRDIGQETKERLAPHSSELLCSRCLSRRCTAHKLRLSTTWQSVTPITYYGCQVCGQSQEFLTSKLIAVLDRNMASKEIQQNGVLRVDWLKYRKIFDFDEVEIVQASDEDVEYFAMQVGNDTDVTRQRKYKQMICRVSSNCDLSENTTLILQRIFGSVILIIQPEGR